MSSIREFALAAAIAVSIPQPLLFAAPEAPPRGIWEIAPDRSEVRFEVTKMGFGEVQGTFRISEGQIAWDPSNPEGASIHWRVSVSSVRTGEPDRDQALQGDSYFEASRFPEMTFESRTARRLADGRIEVRGDITIRGQRRPLTVVARQVGRGAAPVFETDFELDRHEFGIAGGPVLGPLIGRSVRIHLRAATRMPAMSKE